MRLRRRSVPDRAADGGTNTDLPCLMAGDVGPCFIGCLSSPTGFTGHRFTHLSGPPGSRYCRPRYPDFDMSLWRCGNQTVDVLACKSDLTVEMGVIVRGLIVFFLSTPEM